jgi:hypothetical protein
LKRKFGKTKNERSKQMLRDLEEKIKRKTEALEIKKRDSKSRDI